MSAGGLIAQAVLGGTAQAAKGIGDRIRADAKQARADAMLDKKTEDASQLQKERAKLATEKQKLGHKQKTNRLIKSDELGQETYTDEMGPDGKTVIGQREVGSNRLDKYSTSAGKDMSLTNRQKAFAQSLTDRIKAIDDRAEYGAITPEATERRDAMEVQLNALLAGKGRFSELMNGKGDGQGGAQAQAQAARNRPLEALAAWFPPRWSLAKTKTTSERLLTKLRGSKTTPTR